ncbi:MAG: hypothetical protein R2836_00880 [Chitinophagales bacterium]
MVVILLIIHSFFYSNQTDSTFLTSTTCQAENAGIFTDTFTNVYGCDSVLMKYSISSRLSIGKCK